MRSFPYMRRTRETETGSLAMSKPRSILGFISSWSLHLKVFGGSDFKEVRRN